MDRVGIKGDRLIEKNKLKIESSFNTLLRKAGKTTFYEKKAKIPFSISTKLIEKESLSVGNLRQNSTVFYSSKFEKEIDNDVLDILVTIIDDGSFPKNSSREINSYNFKTPLDLVFTKYDPERKFVEQLCKDDNIENVIAWIKSRDIGFYSIEYSITTVAGKHSKVKSFNPDFILKLCRGEEIHFVVVETKTDDDITSENKAKLKYGKQHFQTLNTELQILNKLEFYHFYFLSPNSYSIFFDFLRNGQLLEDKFKSDLELKLENFDE